MPGRPPRPSPSLLLRAYAGPGRPTGAGVRPEFPVAMPIDPGGTKVAVVTQRVESRDYIDVHALLTSGGLSLAEMLAAARIMYGEAFSSLAALKALAYLEDPALASHSQWFAKRPCGGSEGD